MHTCWADIFLFWGTRLERSNCILVSSISNFMGEIFVIVSDYSLSSVSIPVFYIQDSVRYLHMLVHVVGLRCCFILGRRSNLQWAYPEASAWSCGWSSGTSIASGIVLMWQTWYACLEVLIFQPTCRSVLVIVASNITLLSRSEALLVLMKDLYLAYLIKYVTKEIHTK